MGGSLLRAIGGSLLDAIQHKYVDPDGRVPLLIPVVVFIAKELASEAVEQVTGVPMPTLKNAGKQGLKLTIKMKKGWDKSQISEAKAKIKALDSAAKKGELKVVKNPQRSSTSAKSRYEKEHGKGSVGKGNDTDHTKELQLGGADDVSNMSPLNSSVNRSVGAQIQQQIKNVPEGTKVCEVSGCG